MADSEPSPQRPEDALPQGRFSRRNFIKGFGAGLITTAGSGSRMLADEMAAGRAEAAETVGPQAVPMSLKVNGRVHDLQLEPRVTLLDTLRYHIGLTGSKEVCDRATCGACTVLLDGEPTYACMLLAVDVQGQDIKTVEGLAENGKLSPVQEAFVSCDALMCGFCTPGFVLSATALLEQNPKPSRADIQRACSGNICRCGTQPHITEAVLQASGQQAATQPEVLTFDDEDLAE